MKIAILSCFYPFRGGISQFNSNIFNELGKEHTVKAFNFRRQYPEFLFPGRTQYVTPDDMAVPVESEALLDTANPFSYIQTAAAIRRWDPDILIVRYWMSYFAPSLGYVSRRMKKKCKVIQILDNVIPHEPHFFDKPFTRYFLSGGDGFITMCDAVRKDLLDIKPSPPNIVIPHPLYSHFGEKLPRNKALMDLGLDPAKKTILFFGLIRHYKGLDILLEAFGMLGDDYQLIIAGEPYGPFEPYRKLIESIPGHDTRIRTVTQYIKDADVKKYFSAADVTVLPYRSATQSGISSVSYHFEVPMIVTDVGGLKSTVGDTGTGLVAPECTAEAVLGQINGFFNDPALRENCIKNIKKEKEKLSWKEFCSNLLKFAQTI